jgi:predicted AAA+ superfamily ATPase
MFSTELVSLFTGRVSEIEVFPISYKEILISIFDSTPNSNAFNKYLLSGGLGITIPTYKDFSKTINTIEKVYQGCLVKDVKTRHRIQETSGIEKISKFLYNHVGRNTSATNIENYLKSNNELVLSKKTILNYFN